MSSVCYLYFTLFLVFIIYLPRKRRRNYAAKKLFIKNRKMDGKRRGEMKELVERFLGKDVYIKMLEGNADGVLKEVTERGIVLENKNGMQVLNLDYIVKIREYPYKNGKRATVWGE